MKILVPKWIFSIIARSILILNFSLKCRFFIANFHNYPRKFAHNSFERKFYSDI